MSYNNEAISVRTTRLNNIILGQVDSPIKAIRNVAENVNRESLLDALCLLYDECSKDGLRRKEKTITDFVSKYRPIVTETRSLRVNIEDFDVRTMIGKGFFGEVHLVAEKQIGDIYAMKKIPKSSVASSQFKEERDIMASCNSEWITALQYAFQDTEHLYLVMEYLPGGDLLSLMFRNGAFEEDLARFYLAELALALNALHGLGFVHRDVKPENILLDRCGHLKLADFGNASAVNKDGTVTSMSAVGTPEYIAPELLETLNATTKSPRNKYDVACDFWSMGIIGYELVTEETPFKDDSVGSTYQKISQHCAANAKLKYPGDAIVSDEFRDFIDKLVTKSSKRLTYKEIMRHDYFINILWDNLRHQVPPIIPSVSGDDDISNFEDFHNQKKGTYVKERTVHHSFNISMSKASEFSGENLPFLGYSFVKPQEMDHSSNLDDNYQDGKYKIKVNELQKTVDEQRNDIKELQSDLLKSQRRSIKSDSLDKILKETKTEMHTMKEKLKEKTAEIAASRTEIETLKSHLKIERDNCVKTETKIKDIFRSTHQKYEKEKYISDKNYEKQVFEKNNEISNLNEKLMSCEEKLKGKLEECDHLQSTLSNYKDLLRNTKDQMANEKSEYEQSKKQLMDVFETKIHELKHKLKSEKDLRNANCAELGELRKRLDESICSSISVSEAKKSSERNMTDLKSRMNEQINENKELREMRIKLERDLEHLQKQYDDYRRDVTKIHEAAATSNSNRSSTGKSSEDSMNNYRSARGSFSEGVEDQLRSELLVARENENLHRKKAENSQEIIKKLEEMIAQFTQKTNSGLLEKQNEKLEDQLAAAREQAVMDRQSARTANLSLWKLEKQIEDINLEKKNLTRRLEQSDEKLQKIKEEKMEAVVKSRQNVELLASKENDIKDLKREIEQLKREVKKEHQMWESSEKERTKEKNEIVEYISKIHKLEEKIDDDRRKFYALQHKNDSLGLENKRLQTELAEQREDANAAHETVSELEKLHDALKRNYNLLKEACEITETQLTEIENMLESETKRNVAHTAKIDDLWAKLRSKDDEVTKLNTELIQERTFKINAESKIIQMQAESEELRDTLDTLRKQFIEQQQELIGKTANLYNAQEQIEVIQSDASNLQQMNSNHNQELVILKEENTKILTDLFISKDEANRLNRELKDAKKLVGELKQEIDHVNNTMSEIKSYYNQRDIKAEATIAQHKKLIEYLQVKVEEYQMKKKKGLADILFGTNSGTSKKENLPPTLVIESSLQYKKLQEELRLERGRNKNLTEKLLQAKVDLRTKPVVAEETPPATSSPNEVEPTRFSAVHVSEECSRETIRPRTIQKHAATAPTPSSNSSSRSSLSKNHRFEITIESTCTEICMACLKPILAGNSFWKCKECKLTIHRKCRSDVSPLCDISSNEGMESCEEKETVEASEKSLHNKSKDEYYGDVILSPAEFEEPLIINAIYEMDDDTLLLGCDSGLFSYHIHKRDLVHIAGIDAVKFIAITPNVSKSILIGAGGEQLFQCDSRHLLSRTKALACLNPKLDTICLDLRFVNRLTSERWHYAKIHGNSENLSETYAIAATSARIVILRYDIGAARFNPIRALDTAMPVTTVHFTKHTAIVGSDKFFEIDLLNFAHEEFLDFSDSSLGHARGCKPISVFRINKEEYLLCYTEFGIFVDEYGCRSRPVDINWIYIPTGFIYREPILFVAHDNLIQVLRINKSYSKEMEQKNYESDTGVDGSEQEGRVFLNVDNPKLMTDTGKLGVYIMGQHSGGETHDLIAIDGVKALKSVVTCSMDSLLSSMASLPNSIQSSELLTESDL